MLKDKLLEFTETMVKLTRNGESSISTKLMLLKLRDSTKNSVSTSTDHSTSDLECQCKESLQCTETTGFISEDGLQIMPSMLNGDSMRSPRLSSTCTGRTTLWKSTVTEDIHTLEQLLLSTQDGGRCSETEMMLTLSMKRASISMFKVLLTLKEDTSNVTRINQERSISNGISSTLTNGKVSQPRVSSMRNSASMSKEISMSFQKCQITDILISLTTETWSSRLEMEEEPKFGISTRDH